MNTNTNEKLLRVVQSYVEEIEAAIRGELYKDADGEYTMIAPVGDGEDADEREPVSFYDWIGRRALSIENWKINRDGECVGGEILLGYGGPNVWLDEHGVRGYWGGDSARWEITSCAHDAVLDFLSETLPRK